MRLNNVTGIPGIMANMDKFDKQLAAKADRGLKKAGLLLQRKSQQVVPVEFGFLVNSAYTRAKGYGFDLAVTIGYTAEYAVYVHENLEATHKVGKQAKYLEQPARDNRGALLDVVSEVMKS